MVFDQSNSRFGIGSRSDIDYGLTSISTPTPTPTSPPSTSTPTPTPTSPPPTPTSPPSTSTPTLTSTSTPTPTSTSSPSISTPTSPPPTPTSPPSTSTPTPTPTSPPPTPTSPPSTSTPTLTPTSTPTPTSTSSPSISTPTSPPPIPTSPPSTSTPTPTPIPTSSPPPPPPTQAGIRIQLPILIPSDIKCFIITEKNGNAQSISIDDDVDPNDYFNISNYVAKIDSSYQFSFYSGPPNDGSSCSGNYLLETGYLDADVSNDPWSIGRNNYSLNGIKIKVSSSEYTLFMLVIYNGNKVYKTERYNIDKRDNDRNYNIDYVVYPYTSYSLYLVDKSNPAWSCIISTYPQYVSGPWTITEMGGCNLACNK
ncbi:hypothetical protein F8M41_012507 [Gigaspora margarita]|uniref:Uncharacterized protein n=1 Tax=Gigaspora margarita TaxID=4874 RepID=A0A8H3WYU6_GIGMA|nr:hypothetical protein F8M41_012507 [Gigaspora margarita]